MFASKDWLKKTLMWIVFVEVVSIFIARLFIPYPYTWFVGVGLVFLSVWLIHRISRTSKEWLKEKLVLILLVKGVSIVVHFFLFTNFLYSLPFVIGIVVLIVWLHRRNKHADTLDV